MGKKFRRCFLAIALAVALVPFPSFAFSPGGAPSPVFKSETLDIGPHVAVCGLASSMELNAEYHIHLCAWNGNDSGGPVIQGATVWFEIQTAGSGYHVMTSGMMTTDYQGRVVFTQKMNFGEGGFKIRAWMSYLGSYYTEYEWAFFTVFDYTVPSEPTDPCQFKYPEPVPACPEY